ncbi:MAG: alpha/beta hydrolase [Armatimonadota bacterium]
MNNRIVKTTLQCVLLAVICMAVMMASGCAKSTLAPKANAMIDALAKSDYSAATIDVNADMKNTMSAETLKTVWTGLTAKSGAFISQNSFNQIKRNGVTTVFILCKFEKAAWVMEITFDPKDEIIGLRYNLPEKNASEPVKAPAYAQKDRFDERSVSFKSGEGKSKDFTLRVGNANTASGVSFQNGVKTIEATLSVPHGEGPFPVVILVPDTFIEGARNLGVAKPLQDIAWGLASQGIAALRYDNTLSNRQHVKSWTVNEEVIDDVAAAMKSIQNEKTIDKHRIYVLGHGLAGYLAPRMGRDHQQIAGLIVMAGMARPLEDVISGSEKYKALALEPTVSDYTKKSLLQLSQEVARVKTIEPSSNASTVVLGLPVSYWRDLQGYSAVAVAKGLKQPMLIMLGGRDYIATNADLKLWKQLSASRANVAVKLYPDLNQLFISGKGMATPIEYGIYGNVPQQVVSDICGWIKEQK